MSNGKNIKFGHDKRAVSIIPSNEQNLYNNFNGEFLLDEFSNRLITEVDTYYIPDVTAKRSTSVVFNIVDSPYQRISYSNVGIATTATYGIGSTNALTFSTAISGITIGDIITGPGIPDATIVSRVLSNTNVLLSNDILSGVTTSNVRVQRRSTIKSKSNVIWKVAEQFKESSEVSTTLLGINRAEVQLALFANVSSYGLDPDEFEFYSFNSGTSFGSWESRENETYGNRYVATRTEETQESAIKITAFPVPYSYPFGPLFEKLGLYSSTLFNQYKNLLKLEINFTIILT